MHLDHQKILEKYKSYNITVDEAKIKKAVEFAIKYHGIQQRASGVPYYSHPLEVAEIIAEMRLDTDSIITAILHDTIEDTDLTLEEIEENFGKNFNFFIYNIFKI